MAGSGLRLSKDALFRQLGYAPHPLQREVHESTARRRVVACGARFGKTTIVIHECVAALLAPCDMSLGWLVGPSFETSDRTFQQVVALVQRHFPHRIKTLDLKQRRLVVINLGGGRSELRAKSTDATAALLGESLTYCIVDEAATVRREHWEVCAQRLVDQRGWSLVVSVPKGPGWFHDAYRMGIRNRDPEARSWTAPSWANPFVNAATIEAERSRLTEDAFDEQFGGQFVGVDEEPCLSCGGPDPRVSGMILVDGEAPIARCGECGEHVDEHGHTLVGLYPNGQAHLLIIRLFDRHESVDIPGSSPDKRC